MNAFTQLIKEDSWGESYYKAVMALKTIMKFLRIFYMHPTIMEVSLRLDVQIILLSLLKLNIKLYDV